MPLNYTFLDQNRLKFQDLRVRTYLSTLKISLLCLLCGYRGFLLVSFPAVCLLPLPSSYHPPWCQLLPNWQKENIIIALLVNLLVLPQKLLKTFQTEVFTQKIDSFMSRWRFELQKKVQLNVKIWGSVAMFAPSKQLFLSAFLHSMLSCLFW